MRMPTKTELLDVAVLLLLVFVGWQIADWLFNFIGSR